MGLGSLEELDGQALCHILVDLTSLNRLLSRGYWCSHDLTWPQQKLCLMICANGNLNLLLNQISMATQDSRPHCSFCLEINSSFVSEVL